MTQEALVPAEGPRAGNRSLLRRMNSLGILESVLERPRVLRDLAAVSGLSKTAVGAVVADLVELGWLRASGPQGDLRPGRPASTYSTATDLGVLLALDVGAHHVNGVLTDLTGNRLAGRSVDVGEDEPAEPRIAAAVALADALLAESDVTRADVWALTVGSPGVVDTEGVVSYFGGEGMPGWTGLDLRTRFGREFDCAVLVEGDVALGAHAEVGFGDARDVGDVVYVLCGRRTSGAVILGGRVHRGVHGAAGIVGELPELRWADLNEKYGTDVLTAPRPSRERIFELARAGEPAATAAVEEFADDLAIGTAAMVLTLDPELVVIGGGSAPAADVFLPRMTATLATLCPMVPRVTASSLGPEAVALGGIALAQRRLREVLGSAVRELGSFPSPRETRALLPG
jgi:predicted NBD/HSP70 family sugar kinase